MELILLIQKVARQLIIFEQTVMSCVIWQPTMIHY